MPRSRQRVKWGLALAAVSLGVVRSAASFHRDPVASLIGLAVAVVVCGLVAVFFPGLYARQTHRIARFATSGAEVRSCVDPDDPGAWRAVSVDDKGVSILGRKGVVRGPWLYAAMADVGPGLLPGGLTQRGGVVIRMSSGERVGFLLPSRSTLTYPAASVTACVADIQRRRGHESRSQLSGSVPEAPPE